MWPRQGGTICCLAGANIPVTLDVASQLLPTFCTDPPCPFGVASQAAWHRKQAASRKWENFGLK